MEFEYQNSRKDYSDFYKAYCINGFKKRLWAVSLLLVFSIAFFAKKPFDLNTFLIGTGASLVFLLAIYYFIPLLISLIRLNKFLTKEKFAFEKKKLTITEDGLLIESASKTVTWNWESMISIHTIAGFFYIVLADKRVMFFPKKHFRSDHEAVNFIGLIQKKLIPVTTFSRFRVTNTNKNPSYWLGLICLVPFLGAIAGVVFIINGISKYKDKWFVIIGIGGIILSACLWVTYFYTDTFGFKTVIANASQRQINSVMKGVEFYKIKNGVYPDSLEQINNDNSDILWIYDPLQPGEKANKSNEYNYQKVGNHYYLFSSGVDGIPNTKDDIYPQVAKVDSGKFGLIHK